MTAYTDRIAAYQSEYIEDRGIPFLQELISQRDSSVLEVPCGAERLVVTLAS